MTSSPDLIAPPVALPDRSPPTSRESVRRTLLGQALHDTFGVAGARLGLVWISLLGVIAVFAPFLASSHPIALKLSGGSMSFPLFRHLTAVDVTLVLIFFHSVLVLWQRRGAGISMALICYPVAVLSLVVLGVLGGQQLLTFSLFKSSPGSGMGSRAIGFIYVLVTHLVTIAAVLLVVYLLFRAGNAMVQEVLGARGGADGMILLSAVAVVVLSVAAVLLMRPPENVVYEQYREAEKAGKVEFILRTLIPYSPNDRLRDHPDEHLNAPSARHWLGTTNYSEDMCSRMIHACRVALAIGFIATSVSTVIGVVIGGLMGYFAGRLDLIGMRLVEITEAIPVLILLLIVTVSFGRSLYLMMLVIGLLSWPADARFIRAEFLRLRKLDFVQAGVAAGLGRVSIIFRHMLPNGISPVLVNASFGISSAILLESVLSFLGMGLGPDDPSWGQLLEQALSSGTGFSWWIATFPGLAIFLTVFSYILIGESMRDALDPKLRISQG